MMRHAGVAAAGTFFVLISFFLGVAVGREQFREEMRQAFAKGVAETFGAAAKPPPPFRVHARDVTAWIGAQPSAVRCPTCLGERFLSGVACSECGGQGAIDLRTSSRKVAIVEDGAPADYPRD